MKRFLLVLILIVLPLGNLNAQDNNNLLDPWVKLYEKAENRVVLFFNNIIDKSTEESLNLNFKLIEQPLTKGFDFVCYNSCKERNNEDFCMQQCSLK